LPLFPHCRSRASGTGAQPLLPARRFAARELSRRRQRTLANRTDWPDAPPGLKGETAIVSQEELLIERSLPHGHVAATLGMARKLGLHKLLRGFPPRLAKLTLAMIVARVAEPAAKLATARQLSEETAAPALDGFYVLRTSVPAEALDAAAVVSTYKSLAQVERAFRSMKTVVLDVRPIHYRLAARVRAHVFLCMLAYNVVWHIRERLAPLLFDDHGRENAGKGRVSPVAPAKVSAAAKAKAASRKTADGLPVHSFRTLLQDLGTLTRNTVRLQACLGLSDIGVVFPRRILIRIS
jgi:hypothetical protein